MSLIWRLATKFDMAIYFSHGGIDLFFPLLLVLGIGSIIQYKRASDLPTLIFHLLFGLYILSLINVTLFPIKVGGGYADSMRENASWVRNINLVPLQNLRHSISTNALNMIMTIPLGLGLAYKLGLTKRFIHVTAFGIGFVIESLQAFIGLLLNYPYRAIDVNDVIFNALGVYTGCLCFYLLQNSLWPRLQSYKQ